MTFRALFIVSLVPIFKAQKGDIELLTETEQDARNRVTILNLSHIFGENLQFRN